ncbi:MAG: single-stranded-DNA-specific exonuclease RecJ [Chloroflexi bacterium]|nr:single-stranded-DNA-specific exonuclease RecJ [Chloroflexota bacterium]
MDLLAEVGGHPLVTRGLINRGIASAELARPFLSADHYSASSPSELSGIDRAVARIERAIRRQELVCVWGDFDVDGQTATTILVSTLRELGARTIFYIPHRESESHGLSIQGVRRLVEDGVSLIVTCDTGIRDHEAVLLAAELGAKVIITDHHDLPEELPNALAVLNPKLLPIEHPLRDLPGVGAAFLLAWALLESAERGEAARELLDLVALGIVADLARQRGEVRYYLQLGLEQLRSTRRLGLTALIEVAGLAPEVLTESDIGFALAPRLNSLGRLGDANRAVGFLTTDDSAEAQSMAEELEGLNARRKLLTGQVMQAAISRIERESALRETPAIVLEHNDWPEGVIGLVAGRLADRYGKPAVLIVTGMDGVGRASARSIPGVDITAAFAANSSLLEQYGGHPTAGGFSIRNDRITEFRVALYRTLREVQPIQPTLRIDGTIALNELTLELVLDLERLAPFGPGNPSFVLAAKDISIRAVGTLGRNSEHLQLQVVDARGNEAKIIWWQGAREAMPEGTFDLALRPRSRYYKGEQEVQVEWIDARQAKQPLSPIIRPRMPTLVDLRREASPLVAVKRLQNEGVQVWSESSEADELAVHSRWDLTPTAGLAIWTIPPGSVELRAALRKAKPDTVYLFEDEQDKRSVTAFAERLIGLAKFAINQRGGRFNVPRAAAALGHREVTVEAGLEWLEHQGHIVVEQREGEVWTVSTAEEVSGERGPPTSTLQELLRETAAFRDYWRSASISSLRRMIP